MSVLMVSAWRCDKAACGHVWYTGEEEAPARCAKCKSRNWNVVGGVPVKVVERRASGSSGQTEYPEVPSLAPLEKRSTGSKSQVEHPVGNREDAGSNPARGSNFETIQGEDNGDRDGRNDVSVRRNPEGRKGKGRDREAVRPAHDEGRPQGESGAVGRSVPKDRVGERKGQETAISLTGARSEHDPKNCRLYGCGMCRASGVKDAQRGLK